MKHLDVLGPPIGCSDGVCGPLACASARALAVAGRRVLLVGTDPASSLAYRDRMVRPYHPCRGERPEALLLNMEGPLCGHPALRLDHPPSADPGPDGESLLLARGRHELPHVHEAANHLAKRAVLLPWAPRVSVGPEGLAQRLKATSELEVNR